MEIMSGAAVFFSERAAVGVVPHSAVSATTRRAAINRTPTYGGVQEYMTGTSHTLIIKRETFLG